MSMLFLSPASGAYAMAFFIPTILQSLGYNVALSHILSTPRYIFLLLLSQPWQVYSLTMFANALHLLLDTSLSS